MSIPTSRAHGACIPGNATQVHFSDKASCSLMDEALRFPVTDAEGGVMHSNHVLVCRGRPGLARLQRCGRAVCSHRMWMQPRLGQAGRVLQLPQLAGHRGRLRVARPSQPCSAPIPSRPCSTPISTTPAAGELCMCCEQHGALAPESACTRCCCCCCCCCLRCCWSCWHSWR